MGLKFEKPKIGPLLVVIYEVKSYVSERINPEEKNFRYVLRKTRRGGSKRGICGHYSNNDLMFITVLGLYLLGDGMRDRFDPKLTTFRA